LSKRKKAQEKKSGNTMIEKNMINKNNNFENYWNMFIKALKESDIIYFKILLFVSPFFYGLFYDFTSALAGIVLSFYLIFLLIRRRQFSFSTELSSLLLLFVFFSYLIVSIWAIDHGMAFLGFLKFSPCIIFLLILMQLDKDEIHECFSVLPWSGIIMVIISAATIFIPDLSVYFYDARRLGGFFQYANTFALFLLIGVIITAYQKESTPTQIFKLVVLIIGILLTGSRISFVIMFGLLLYFAISFKNLRKRIGIITGSLFLLVIIFVLATGNIGNIGRITTVFSESSTFIGRLLYDIDALKLLLQKPFGVGYMGYYYLQPLIQSGVYAIRFVHNEFLQIALDAGILSLLAFCFVSFKSLFSKKTESMEKIILGTILLHAFFEFDFQYLIILFILLMTLDFGESKIFQNESFIQSAKIGLMILAIIYGYVSLGLFLGHLGNNETSLKMIPFNTEIKIQILSKAQSPDEIQYWSDAVLSANKNIALAYEGKAVVASQENDYEVMVSNMQKVVTISKYDLKKYEEYLIVLEKAMNYYNEQGDRENLLKYANLALAIPEQLNKVTAETHPLAYMIDDQPKLQLSQEAQNYLSALKKALSN